MQALVAALGGADVVNQALRGGAGGSGIRGGGPAAALAAAAKPPGAAAGSAGIAAGHDADAESGDIRILPVQYNFQDQRYREFRAAVERLSEDSFKDWPVPGPRTTIWCLKFMLENGGTPKGWHSKWKSECRLQPTDGGVAMHDAACSFLELGLCYDQLQLGNCAFAEQVCRQLQMVEERWKERMAPSDALDSETNMHLFLGQSTRGNLCIAATLQQFIAEQLTAETVVTKDRRKACEERAFTKPKKEGPKGGSREG